MTEFGAFRPVNVRTAWKHEQYDFTPWLAEEENIALLSETLGMDLEVEDTEVSVGPYSADLLARDVEQGYVVVENQFGKTNHDHLGKLITYAAFLDAKAVIWIAEDFTDEHHKALDWLNDHTAEGLSFFGVALELWQIDESKPAVRFNVVSRPNTIVRQAVAAKAAVDVSDTKKLQHSFWKDFCTSLLEQKILNKTQAPKPRYWFNVPLGKTGVKLSCIASVQNQKVGIRVYIQSSKAKGLYEELEKQKVAIELEIGETLQWNPETNNKDKTISLKKSTNFHDQKQWQEAIDWLSSQVVPFRKVFGPKVKNYQVDDMEEE